MIWQLTVAVLLFAVIMLHQALETVSPISALISLLAWAYLASLAGSIQVVTQSGDVVNLGYQSLAIFCVLMALASILVAIWAFSEETQEAVDENSTGYSLGSR